jgi:hypothetical protein
MDPWVIALVAVSAVLHLAWNVRLKTAGDPLRAATIGMLAGCVGIVPIGIAIWWLGGRPSLPVGGIALGLASGVVEAAYFIPDALMSRELIRARERGVRIRLLLPDKHIDSETVRIASKRAWGSLLEQGVEIHRYEPTMLHCKMLIFDQYMVSVGSTNFDMRSF